MYIRKATLQDAKKITEIYNQGIRDRIATLDVKPHLVKERREWLAKRDCRHPVMVAVNSSGVVGWASINVFNAREVYNYVGDISVYVDRNMRGKGIGTLLLQRIEEEAKKLNFHKLVLAGFPFNIPAISLYRKVGFRKVGIYQQQGLLEGKWVDVVIMEKIL